MPLMFYKNLFDYTLTEEHLENMFNGERKTTISHYQPGEYFHIDSGTVEVIRDVMVKLLTFDGQYRDKAMPFFAELEHLLVNSYYFTYQYALAFTYRITILHTNVIFVDKFIGVITEGLLARYIEIISNLMQEKPEWCCIYRHFLTAVQEINKNKEYHNNALIGIKH